MKIKGHSRETRQQNASIRASSQTLARSINTSLTTLFTITPFISLVCLQESALPMMVGIIAGAYSFHLHFRLYLYTLLPKAEKKTYNDQSKSDFDLREEKKALFFGSSETTLFLLPCYGMEGYESGGMKRWLLKRTKIDTAAMARIWVRRATAAVLPIGSYLPDRRQGAFSTVVRRH